MPSFLGKDVLFNGDLLRFGLIGQIVRHANGDHLYASAPAGKGLFRFVIGSAMRLQLFSDLPQPVHNGRGIIVLDHVPDVPFDSL